MPMAETGWDQGLITSAVFGIIFYESEKYLDGEYNIEY